MNPNTLWWHRWYTMLTYLLYSSHPHLSKQLWIKCLFTLFSGANFNDDDQWFPCIRRILEFVSPRFGNGMLFSIWCMQKSVIVCFAETNFMCLVSRQKCFSPSLKLFTEKRFSPQISQHKHYLFVYGHMCMWNFYVKKLDRRIHDFCSFNEYVCLAFNIIFSYKDLLLTVKSIFPLQSFHRGLLDVVG